MKKFLALLIILIPILQAQESENYIEKKFDKFKNKTSISTNVQKLGRTVNAYEQPRISVVLEYIGKTPAPGSSPSIVFSFGSLSDDWKYLSCYPVYCLADDEPLKIPEFKRYGKVLDGGDVVEIVYSEHFPYSKFEKLCDAKSLEFKICNTEFVVSEIERMMLRQARALFKESMKSK